MSATHEDGSFGVLQQIFADVANDMRRDPLEHMLILTYEFDDEQLVNLLTGRRLADQVELRRNQIKFIADMQPVVIYDARKTREFNHLPHFLDLLPVNPGAYRCHHSKAYLFVTRRAVRLVIGSFNLTRTGLFENREVFVDFFWNDDQRADIEVLRSFSALLRRGYARWAQPAAASARVAIADTLDARVAHWQSRPSRGKPGNRILVHSGYEANEASGLRRLAELWKKMSDAPPRQILVVSPFFDRGSEWLADELFDAIGVPAQLHFVTDESGICRLGRRHYGPDRQGQKRRLSLVPGLIDQHERTRIEHANDGARLDGLEIKRDLHAKILVLCSGSQHLLYTGSANFTRKAWCGDNQELGIVQIEAGNADKAIARILAALSASSDDAYERLGHLPDSAIEAQEEDDDYTPQSGYPDFIEGIVLEREAGGTGLVFRFQTSEPARLRNYVIDWGRVRLSIDDAQSHALPIDAAYMPLQGSRNLKFSPCAFPESTFLLTFVQDAELTRQHDLEIFPSAEEWMRYYLQRAGGGIGIGEALPGADDASGPVDDADDDRHANVVIAMQRYLNLFAGVEIEFQKRAAEIEFETFADAASRARACDKRIVQPLRAYAELLKQERSRMRGGIDEQVYVFRAGELALLIQRLAARLPELADFPREIANGIVTRQSNTALRVYLKFIKDHASQH
ncbi:hypothetical protein AWB78_07333 [Caballeronia calidae]|uniref:PLD phosphodiesterase domain-containing protein n=1 Tax=Caballeronia calidae TaxID=1777139 RepID=A0A158EEG9_9BURK|nr:hypothetical protein [Caballeronia calidae]SAL05163.1 hypothetical protein AWB78_07333 [Caballeronia calidae]